MLLAAVFGFAAALFLALLAAPTIARRVSDLTWRNALRALPQSAEEIAAERDHLRGIHAMEVRRTEMRIERYIEEHNNLRAERAGLENRIRDLNAEADAFRETLLLRRRGREEAEERLESANTQISVLRTEIAANALQSQAVQDTVATVQNEAKALSRDLANARARAEKAEAQADALRADLTGLKMRHAILETDARAMRAESKRLAQELRAAQRRLDPSAKAAPPRAVPPAANQSAKRADEQPANQLVRKPAAQSQPATKAAAVPAQSRAVKAGGVAAGAMPAAKRKPAKSKAAARGESEIAARMAALHPTFEAASSATPAGKASAKSAMMDLAAMVVAEAARDDAGLAARIAKLPEPASELGAAIRRRAGRDG
jgi:hypothetical protein